MSITPLPTGPSVTPTTSTGEAGASGEHVDGTFAALVSTLLGEGQPTPADPAVVEGVVVPVVPAVPGEAGEEAPVDPAAAEATVEGDEAVVPVPTPLWQAITGQLVTTPATGLARIVTPASPEGGPAAVGSVEGTAPAAVTTPAAAASAAASAVALSAASEASPAGDVVPTDQQQGTGTKAGTSTTVEGVQTAATDGAVTEAATSASGDTAQGQPGEQQAGSSPRSTTDAGQVSSASGTTATAPASAVASTPTASTTGAEARPMPVVSQLAPEVTRLVSRGDGLHSITMLLQPEALGEVRVTLTVRDGEVLVRLAAGDDAQRALLEGAPELRRVLELAGAGDARVVVRDLPGAQTSQQGWGHSPERSATPDSAGAFSNGDTHASGHGRRDEHDQHARTRGGSTARDGLTDGATQHRPNPVVAASPGIDLTM